MATTRDSVTQSNLAELADVWPAIDPVIKSAYVKRFEAEVRAAAWAPVDEPLVRDALLSSDMVLCGDFHALPSAAKSATELIAGWCAAGRETVLALEMIHARDQSVLDAFLAGGLREAELKRAIRWREEWGYAWEAAGALLRRARALGVPVLALDQAPRGGARELAWRDRVAAERIARVLRGSSRAPRIAVLYGEAHFAAAHVPRALAAAFDGELRVARLFHDLELAGQGGLERGVHFLAAGGRTFARQSQPPGARARALEATWRRWARDVPHRGEIDFPHLVHTLIDAQAGVLGIDLRRARRGPARWLADDLPRVFGPDDARDAARALGRAGTRAPGTRLRIAASRHGGVQVHAPSNAVLVLDPGLGSVALATARWLGCALRAPSGAALDTRPLAVEGHRAADALALALALIVDPALDARAAGLAPAEIALGSGLAKRFRAGRLPAARLRSWLRAPLDRPEPARRLLARLEQALTRSDRQTGAP